MQKIGNGECKGDGDGGGEVRCGVTVWMGVVAEAVAGDGGAAMQAVAMGWRAGEYLEGAEPRLDAWDLFWEGLLPPGPGECRRGDWPGLLGGTIEMRVDIGPDGGFTSSAPRRVHGGGQWW